MWHSHLTLQNRRWPLAFPRAGPSYVTCYVFIVRGWPFGPVNVPFWGETCRAHGSFCKQGGFGSAEALRALRRAVLAHSLRNSARKR